MILFLSRFTLLTVQAYRVPLAHKVDYRHKMLGTRAGDRRDRNFIPQAACNLRCFC